MFQIKKALKALLVSNHQTAIQSPHRIVSPNHGTPRTYQLTDADAKKIALEIIVVINKYPVSYTDQNAVLYTADQMLFQSAITRR